MYKISISVIITCHNLHVYLKECVDSVTNQTMRATEIIILHDACEPPPVFPETTTVVRSSHRGVAVTRNEGARLAESEYLLFLDADDTLAEHFIEAMVNIKAETKADIIYPNVILWSSWHGKVRMRNAWHESCEKITKENMLEYNQIVVSSLISRQLYLDVGGTPNIPILEDYSLWMKCLARGATFMKSGQSVLRYRQRTEGRLRHNDELKNEWYYKIREMYTSSTI
ncbi:MAG TPA: glycosyltransferase [Candidatus Acidoferrum sp.]|nr:glycosyltransferase [Candidatus Acidoferrum sp.]